ncbi:TlpA family protein disulfide reductase [Sediminivirga luteola]|uniref:Thiol-disulfide isomerase n=1 Tax=Sediminivirga luteola TaxID=1774748 RepID=A0A8J2XHN9_9MICO|nr:TlpA disulfide reductase family protein [Sediminivirga luteola]GGA02177.1 thiol-disulfide isomerase [Sediminivirga luteola]
MSTRPASRSARLPRAGRRGRALTAAVLTAALAVGVACSPASDGLAEQAGEDKGYIAGAGVITQLGPSERGEPIDLAGEYTDGEPFDLQEWRGAPVVINLWYAACPPCRTEAPGLQANYEEFQDDGVRFLGVNVRDEAPTAEAFHRTFELTYQSMLDRDGAAVSALSNVLPPQATPSTVVLDAEGRAAARVVGEVDESTLRALISDVLAEQS